jgi:hypothetical protein
MDAGRKLVYNSRMATAPSPIARKDMGHALYLYGRERRRKPGRAIDESGRIQADEGAADTLRVRRAGKA